jgi:hypothetical protein
MTQTLALCCARMIHPCLPCYLTIVHSYLPYFDLGSGPTPSPSPVPSPRPSPSPTPGCPSGWSIAVGTLYDSWPKPGSKECTAYEGCKWAGMFSWKYLPGGVPPSCISGAQLLPAPDNSSDIQCRFPESLVKTWNMAATYELDQALLGKKVGTVMSEAQGIQAIGSVLCRLRFADMHAYVLHMHAARGDG